MTSIGIVGYGNRAKGVECAIRQNEDMSLVAVFTRRDPASVQILTPNVPVLSLADVENYKDKMNTSVKKYTAAEATLEMAQKSYNISEKMYEVGKATLVELNDAQLALTQAQLNMSQAIYQYITNKAAIDELMGVEYVKEENKQDNQ